MASLADVQSAVLAEDTLYLGPIRAFVVNFVAENPFSLRFIYRGCTARTRKGLCKVSIEGPQNKHSKHNAVANQTYVEFYRFELVLFDDSQQSNYEKPGLRASIWEAATELLNLSATSMATLKEQFFIAGLG